MTKAFLKNEVSKLFKSVNKRIREEKNVHLNYSIRKIRQFVKFVVSLSVGSHEFYELTNFTNLRVDLNFNFKKYFCMNTNKYRFLYICLD